MIQDMPTIGARFDIDKVNAGYYGASCWRVFWQAIKPEDIGIAYLFEGNTAATLNGSENVFCIVVQCLDRGAVEKIQAALSESEAFTRVSANPMFVEGSSCTEEPLIDAGKIDAEGSLVGEAGASRSALGAVKRERAAASEPAEEASIPARAKPASSRTQRLPAVSSFDELKTFLGKEFTPEEYPVDGGSCCWMTPEELCDVVERYADLILVYYNEDSCGASEDMCYVSLFEKTPPGMSPIGFVGLYPFPSTSDARSYGQDWRSAPEYAEAMPRLADVRGRYHFNFHGGGSANNSLSKPFDPSEGIQPESLWGRLYLRKKRFLDDLAQEQNGEITVCPTDELAVKPPGSTTTHQPPPLRKEEMSLGRIHCNSCNQTFVGIPDSEGRCPLCRGVIDGNMGSRWARQDRTKAATLTSWGELVVVHLILGIILAIAWGLETGGGGWRWLGHVFAIVTFIGFMFSFSGTKWYKCQVGIAITLVTAGAIVSFFKAIF